MFVHGLCRLRVVSSWVARVYTSRHPTCHALQCGGLISFRRQKSDESPRHVIILLLRPGGRVNKKKKKNNAQKEIAETWRRQLNRYTKPYLICPASRLADSKSTSRLPNKSRRKKCCRVGFKFNIITILIILYTRETSCRLLVKSTTTFFFSGRRPQTVFFFCFSFPRPSSTGFRLLRDVISPATTRNLSRRHDNIARLRTCCFFVVVVFVVSVLSHVLSRRLWSGIAYRTPPFIKGSVRFARQPSELKGSVDRDACPWRILYAL